MNRAGHVVAQARARAIHRHGAAVLADLPESRRLQPWPLTMIVVYSLWTMVWQTTMNQPGRWATRAAWLMDD